MAINTEKGNKYLFKKNAKSEILCFSDSITDDDLKRIYYMLSGNYKSLEIFKEYLLIAFKEKEYLIFLVEKRLKWLNDIEKYSDFGDSQLYNFGDTQIFFKCDRHLSDDFITYEYNIKAKMENENDWEEFYKSEKRKYYYTGQRCVEICDYAYKPEIIKKLGINYIRENLGTDYDRRIFDYYIEDNKIKCLYYGNKR